MEKIYNYFIKKYKKIKDDYLSRSPKGKWDFVRNIANSLLQMIGVAVIDLNFKVWWYSYMGAVVLINTALSFLYTLWYFYHIGTPLEGILLIALFGIFVSVCVIIDLF